MKKILLILCLCGLLFIQGCKADEKIEIVDEEIINEGYIDGVFVEDYEIAEYATTITFYKDNTFTSYLNVCKAMVDVKGEYKLYKGKIYLYFNEETGFDFIDNNQPYIFNYKDNLLLLDSNSVSYSCAYIDRYIKQ